MNLLSYFSNLSLNQYGRGYGLTWKECLLFPICSPYAGRHAELMKKKAPSSFGHKVLFIIELIPLLGATVSLAERVIVEISWKCTRKRQVRELKFTLEDITKLSKECLGLRHVSSKEQWDREATEGFPSGCSLSLSAHEAQFEGLNKLKLFYVPELQMDRFVSLFERGVDHFIECCINYDLAHTNRLIDKGKTRVIEVAQIVNLCGLSIIDYSLEYEGRLKKVAVQPTDLPSWGLGLGRIAKMDIKEKQITGLPFVRIEDLGFSHAELLTVIKTEKQGDIVFRRLVNCYRSHLIDALRKRG